MQCSLIAGDLIGIVGSEEGYIADEVINALDATPLTEEVSGKEVGAPCLIIKQNDGWHIIEIIVPVPPQIGLMGFLVNRDFLCFTASTAGRALLQVQERGSCSGESRQARH